MKVIMGGIGLFFLAIAAIQLLLMVLIKPVETISRGSLAMVEEENNIRVLEMLAGESPRTPEPGGAPPTGAAGEYTPTPTATSPPPTETPFYMPVTGDVLASTAVITTVELMAGWPQEINFNSSDVITLALTIPKSLVDETTFPKSLVDETPFVTPGISTAEPDREITEQVTELCRFQAGDEGVVIANLDGSAFDISPQGAQPEPLDKLNAPSQQISWIWSITPKRTGMHKLNLRVEVEWTSGDDGQKKLCDIWNDMIEIKVRLPFLATEEFTVATWINALIGSVFSVPFLYQVVSDRRKRIGKENP